MVAGTQGTVSFIGNSPLLTGSFSGLDTAAIIEASLAVKRIPIDRLNNRISENDTRIAAFNEFKALLETMQSAVNGLRNPPGSTGILSNVFEQKSAFATSDTTTPATEILGATATNNAAPGTYEIVVEQIAEAHKVSGSTLTDVTTDLTVNETLTINLAGAAAEETATIDITSGMTATDVVFAINAVTGTTGIRASALKIADNDYRIVFTAEDTNKDIEIVGDNAGATLNALGVSADNGATYTTVLQPSQPARLTLDGIATVIERDSNEIDDLIDDVTLDLFKADVATTITLEIESDLSGVRAQIDAFVASYNDVKLFLQSQSVVSEEGEVDAAAILFGDNLLRSLGRDLGTDIAELVDGLDATALATLRNVGIELNDEGLLTIDEGTLNSNLVDKLDEVRGVFEFGFQASSPDIRLISRNELLNVGDFTIVDPGGAIDGTNLQVGGVDAFAVDGGVLRGLDGTVYEGMTLAYNRDTTDAGAGAVNIDISTSLGIAERLYQRLDDYVNAGDGLITEETIRLSAQNENYVGEIETIEARLLIFQNKLIEKYAAMERAVAAAEAAASQLKAFLNGGED